MSRGAGTEDHALQLTDLPSVPLPREPRPRNDGQVFARLSSRSDWGLTLGSPIRTALRCVCQRRPHFILLRVDVQFSSASDWGDCPSPVNGLAPSQVKWPYVSAFVSGLWALGSIPSVCMSVLRQDHTALITVAL